MTEIEQRTRGEDTEPSPVLCPVCVPMRADDIRPYGVVHTDSAYADTRGRVSLRIFTKRQGTVNAKITKDRGYILN